MDLSWVWEWDAVVVLKPSLSCWLDCQFCGREVACRWAEYSSGTSQTSTTSWTSASAVTTTRDVFSASVGTVVAPSGPVLEGPRTTGYFAATERVSDSDEDDAAWGRPKRSSICQSWQSSGRPPPPPHVAVSSDVMARAAAAACCSCPWTIMVILLMNVVSGLMDLGIYV